MIDSMDFHRTVSCFINIATTAAEAAAAAAEVTSISACGML